MKEKCLKHIKKSINAYNYIRQSLLQNVVDDHADDLLHVLDLHLLEPLKKINFLLLLLLALISLL